MKTVGINDDIQISPEMCKNTRQRERARAGGRKREREEEKNVFHEVSKSLRINRQKKKLQFRLRWDTWLQLHTVRSRERNEVLLGKETLIKVI